MMKCLFQVFSLLFAYLLLALYSHSYLARVKAKPSSPNIIFILADDAGWNDISFHGSSQIPTPNIDALALNGIILNSYYGSPLCTPTRGAIMTGKHPIHLRLQHFVVMGGSVDGLPLKEKLLPEYLKEKGYSTHLVGKWHLGHSRKELTPTFRGFDSHVGYWLGKQDYYSHITIDGGPEGVSAGYDFRRNLSTDFTVFGKYDTDIFTEEALNIIENHEKDKPLFLMMSHIAPHAAFSYQPLQAPRKNIDKFENTINDTQRRKYAGMMDKLDESVGLVVKALADENMLENSIIIFSSDNGGAPDGLDLNFGSNWPLRGVKNTLWEGGTRLSACIWSSLIQNRVSNDLFHVQDWLPTLYEAIGGNTSELRDIDGVSLWRTLTENEPSPRVSMLYNIDDIYNNSAIRHGPWKLIQGNTTTGDLAKGWLNWDGWYGPSGRFDESNTNNNNETEDAEEVISRMQSSLAGIAIAAIAENASTQYDSEKLHRILKDAEVNCGNSEEFIACNPYNGPCLFNVEEDPCERKNLAAERPDLVEELLKKLNSFNETALSPNPRVGDPKSAPTNWNYIWVPWKDF